MCPAWNKSKQEQVNPVFIYLIGIDLSFDQFYRIGFHQHL
jgi:hypothetical protein